MTWHSKLIQRRKRKRQSALDSFQSQKHAKLIKSCFSLWKQRSTEYLVLQNEAEEIRQERESDLVEDIFNHWKEKTQFLRSLQNLAINHYSSQLIKYPRRIYVAKTSVDIFRNGEPRSIA